MHMNNKLTVKNLVVSFQTPEGKVQAVRDISFTLKKGETLALVGESGCGKSATAKAILGVLAENAVIEGGSILYEDRDLIKLSEKELCDIRGDKISMIFQEPTSCLDPVMRVGRQLAETMLIKAKRHRKPGEKQILTRTEAKSRAIRLLKEVGLDNAESCYNKYPFELSGGMCQRVAIAIALANDPDVLICDEPTTALDVTIQAQILELLCKLQKERGLSIIFITHDLGVVANMADRVGVMYAGKIVETGTCEEIFYAPAHPYTWALLSAIPDLETKDKLEAIPGMPPDMISLPKGDAFAPRNPYALQIDYEMQPPMFQISDTHAAATWLLHPDAPKACPPKRVRERIKRMQKQGGACDES